jgi:hypothetical protein
MKVSILIPVIRKSKVDRLIKNIHKNSGISKRFYEILVLEDRELEGCPKTLSKLVSLSTNDLLVYLGDDTEPMKGFLSAAWREMNTFPDKWGLVGFQDFSALLFTPNINEYNTPHFMIHRKLIDRIGGEIFYTGYKHDGAYELFIRARSIKRYKLSHKSVVKHNHPLFCDRNGFPLGGWDEHYTRVLQKDVIEHDIELLKSRMMECGLPGFPMYKFPWEDFKERKDHPTWVRSKRKKIPDSFFKESSFKFSEFQIRNILSTHSS